MIFYSKYQITVSINIMQNDYINLQQNSNDNEHLDTNNNNDTQLTTKTFLEEDKRIYNDDPMNKRRKTVANYLNNFFPNVISNLISGYDYYLEGKVYTFSKKYYIKYCIAILPDKRIVGGSHDGTVNIWNIETGICEIAFRGHTGPVLCVAATTSYSSYQIVSGSHDATLRLWNMKTLKCDIIFKGHTEPVNCVAILPDGRIVSGSSDTTLKIWDLQTGICTITFNEHSSPINRVSVLPLERSLQEEVPDERIISSSEYGTFKCWNSKTGICNVTIQKEFDNVYSFTILRNSQIITMADRKLFRIYDSKTGLCNATFENKYHNHYNHIYLVYELPDERNMFVVNKNTIKIVNQPIITFDDSILKVIPIDRALLEEVPDRDITIFDTVPLTYGIAVLPDGRIIIATEKNELKILY
jgi:WD40 repeat protein